MRVLITGITGFAGSHLAEYCLARTGIEVIGLARDRRRLHNVSHLDGRIGIVQADMRDAGAVDRALVEAAPEIVFHLAGQPNVPLAFSDPVGTLMDNVVGQLNLIQAMLRHAPHVRLLVVGSGTAYGNVRPQEVPVDENVLLRPSDPYAVSKATQDLMAYQYFLSHQLQAVRVRPFNHTGPRQSVAYVVSRFAQQIAQIEAGQIPPELHVGNLSAVRDFTDVRDIVRAYFLAATQGEPGEVYNIGSGHGRTIDEVLRLLTGFSSVRFDIHEEPSSRRPWDTPIMVCNVGKFHERTGWEANMPLERTLVDTLNYWRAQIPAVHAPTPLS